MTKPKITFYVDIVSPFAYLGFYALENFPVFKNVEVTYVPILLGGLMKLCGNTPPLQVKNKDKWIDIERIRWAKYLDIPVSDKAPPGFPINTIAIQRALTALTLTHPASLAPAISLFYQNFWVHYSEPHKPENLLAILTTILGSEDEAKKVVEKSKSDEVKKLLMQYTQMAFQQESFGLPWFIATNAKGETERFWGVDHMGQLCDFLGLERPTSKGWKALL